MFKFVCQEAARLGLQVNMTNDASWCDSGGPWVTPERSMQVVVYSQTEAAGGRMIGDQHLPADGDWARNGHLLRWPQWVLDGKRSPTDRYTFTTWQLWKKIDPLVESGLLGPVQLLTQIHHSILM